MKATLILPNGTKVEIDGEPDEVHHLVATFSAPESTKTHTSLAAHVTSKVSKRKARTGEDEDEGVSELAIVNRIKEDESLQWLHMVIDSRDMTRRVLVPLYVAAEINPHAEGITSGFISRVYTELGVRINLANVSRELSGKAKKYVLADIVRRKGAPVRYKISRVGRALLEQSRNG